MGGSRHIGFRALHVSLTVDLASAPGLTAGQEERTFSERYLLIVKLRNFDYVQEDTAMRASTSGVYITLSMAASLHFVIQNKSVILNEVKNLTP